MKSLVLEGSLPEIVRSDTIEYLYFTLKSISDDCVALRIFPLDSLPRLRMLYLSMFPDLEMISQDHVHNHLESMTIKECPKFESLPANMHIPSLNELLIKDCPKLESFPEGGLSSNLKTMTLKNCSRLLVDSLKEAFRDIPSLESLSIEKVDTKCFPDEGLLPLSLTKLVICDFPNLEKLEYKGLYHLSSLKSLRLDKCPNLRCLPNEGLPTSISYLTISDCRLLTYRCQEGGEDWEKICHIQDLSLRHHQ